MLPAGYHELFEITATVSGTLIGLLFVAVSVLPAHANGLHRIKASAAMTAFTNALAVSLFALLPGTNVGSAALYVSVLGCLFVLASLLSILRDRRMGWSRMRDLFFLVGLAGLFGVQLVAAIKADAHPHDVGPVNTIGILVIACFFIGIARSWELMGGPSIGLTGELTAAVRAVRHGDEHESERDEPAPTPEEDTSGERGPEQS